MDLEEAVRFYRDVMGLIEVGRDAQGRAYFKAWDERDHNSLILRQADRAGIDHFAFRVANKETLERLDSDLRAYGLKTERVPAGEMLGTGERVRFEIPTGHVIELFAEKLHTAAPERLLNPTPWTAQSEKGIAPLRMDHCLMYGPDLDGVIDIFTNVLGFYMPEWVETDEDGTKIAVWLSCSIKAHDVAFVRHPDPGKLHHVSFLLESWEKVLRAGDICSMNKVPLDIGPTRHGITRGTTIYAFDPSGNRFETYCGGYQCYPDWEPIRWKLSELGSGLDYPQRKLHESFLTVVT
jgi:catechol 2,3-dioxygenase